MGSTDSTEKQPDVYIDDFTKPVYLCTKLKKYKNKPKYLVSNIKSYVFDLDSPLKFDVSYYTLYVDDGNIYDKINFVDSVDENSDKLYFIQNIDGTSALKSFDNVILDDPTKNLSSWVKVSKPIILDDIDILFIDPFYISEQNKRDISLRDYIKETYGKSFGSKIKYVAVIYVPHGKTGIKTQKYKELLNSNLGYTIKDLDPESRKQFFIHNTFNFDVLFKSKKICNSGECKNFGFNEKTGKFNYNVKINQRTTNPEMPGIYFTHFELGNLITPMQRKSKFETVKHKSYYGSIGLVYSVEYLFSNYHVNLKTGQNYGYGNETDVLSYFQLFGDEAIVRANTIPLDAITYLTVEISSFEKKFIYESLGRRQFTFGDVIDLYNENSKTKWYIRKSNLLKILKLYKSDIPPIVITFFNYGGASSLRDYGTVYDTDSDDDLMN